METLPCLQEVELICLSGDIPHTSYSKLCNALGYSYDWCQTTLANHRGNYIEAMTEILIKWNTERAEKSQLRTILGITLHFVNLGGLGKKLSQGEFLPRHQEPHEQQATPLQSSSGEYFPRQQEPHEQEAKPLQSSSDIYNNKISESMTVQQCREKLKNKYKHDLCKIQMKPWDKSDFAEFEDMHTVVTMMKKDANGKDTNNKEILKGSVAEIFSTKVKGVLPARILISAPAGRGKTTAVAKMAYDWVHGERGSALEHLPLLFVVKFRNTSQLSSIGEAIKSQLLNDVDDLTPEGLERFIKENQGICHVILDGLDEYAGISSSHRSSGISIVSVIRWEEFPECRVLVTTRPHLDTFFDQDSLPRIYTKMWIEGFSQESSREYIDRFFVSTSNPSKGEILKDYLNEQPLIDELVKTPLFCLMICHLWNEGLLHHETTTQTELLDNVNYFLMHYANERSKSRVKITSEELRKIICQMGEVALTGLLDDAKKLVFTPHDFRKVPAILDRACELGLVSKTTVYIKCLPQSNKTISTTIEFYHKLAQEHSAGKFLAAKTKKYMLRLKISKLDRLLHKIKASIGDYENLMRFTAGSDNSLCIRIMEAVLANSRLNESERYRIILDCSSETKGTEGNVSSLVQRCVNAQCVVLKAPTVYTVVGMQNLPNELKREVKTIRFEESTLTSDVTSGLWSCLKSFSMLRTLTISDSSLSFPSSPPELPSVTKLSAERVTSQTYEGVLSSVPGVREIDVSIDVAGSSNTHQTRDGDERLFVHIRLHAWQPLNTHGEIDSGESNGGLILLFGNPTRIRQRLHVSGVKDRDEEALVDLFVKTNQLTSLNSGSGGGSLSDTDAVQNIMLVIHQCQLSTDMTEKLWSYLRSSTLLNQLTISDSSLSFHSSPLELTSVTKLSAKKMTSQNYESVLSSLPGVRDIDVSIDVAETSDPFQIVVHIRLHAWPALTKDRKIASRETIGQLSLLFEDETKTQQRLHVSGVTGRDEEALVDLFVKSEKLTYLNSRSGGGSHKRKNAVHNTRLEIEQCRLSTEMTEKLWYSLRSYTPSLNKLTISDSSLSLPTFPPKLLSVTKLSAERVTSHSYEGLLSSIPGLEEVDVTIGDANADEISQIQTSLRRHLMEHDLTRIDPHSFTSERNVSRKSAKRMKGLGCFITECQTILSGVVFGPKETVINLVQSSMRLMSASLYVEQFSRSLNSNQDALHLEVLTINDCQLSTEMTVELWSRLRSFTSLKHLTISVSSLSFPPFPPELRYVTKLSVDRVTSQSYEGLLSSLPGLREMVMTIDDAERDIPQIITGSKIEMWTIKDCQLSTEITVKLWSCLKSFTSLNKLTISDSSLSFPSSPPELLSVTTLSAERLTSHSYDGLLSSLPGLKKVDITIGDENTEDISHIQTSLRRHLMEHDLTRINPHSFTSERNVSSKSTKRMRGLGLLITYSEAILSGVVFGPKETVIDLVQPSTRLISASLYVEQFSRSIKCDQDPLHFEMLTIKDCQLSTKMSVKLWSCLRSFTSLNHLIISDASLSFPPYPPQLRYVTKLSVERVTSQCYEGLLSSLPGLREMVMAIDDAERDIPQIITRSKIQTLTVKDCQLSIAMTFKLWSFLRSFTSLNHLTISDSSLSFPSSPPELSSITKLSGERVTSQSYEGLLSSLPGLREINISIDDAERDIPQITAGLRRTGGQQLTNINLKAPYSLPSEKKSASRETMRGLGLLIEEQTKNLRCLHLAGVESLDEESLVYLIECCRRVWTVSDVWLFLCGTMEGGSLECYLCDLHTSTRGNLSVHVYHDRNVENDKSYIISHIG